MPTLLPYRDYDEKDKINLYSWSGAIPVNKGTLVKVVGSGVVWGQEPNEMLGAPGASYANTVSERYGVPFKVAAAGTGDKPLGILEYDVKEVDENGNLLKWDRNRAWEREIALSGDAVPIIAKGRFMYSGITGAVTAGQDLYAGAAGTIEATQASAAGPGVPTEAIKVGRALGEKDATNGFCLVQLDLS